MGHDDDHAHAERRPKGRPRGERPRLKSIVTLRGSPEYAEWLTQLAAETGLSKADLVAEGLRVVARARKVQAPPERMGGH